MSIQPKSLTPDEVARLLPRRAFVLMYRLSGNNDMEYVAKWSVDGNILYCGATADEALGKLVYGLLEIARDNLARAEAEVEERRHELFVLEALLHVEPKES